MRMYLVENRLYQVLVVSTLEGHFAEDISSFMNSFSLR